MTDTDSAQHFVKVIEGGGDVVLVMPPPFNVPGNTFVPPSGRLMGVKDARTGETFPGVMSLKLKASADEAETEITVRLREVAVPHPDKPGIGRPARTTDDLNEAVRAHGSTTDLPWVSTLYRVVGFELGPTASPTFDPVDFEQDENDEA